jgi:hypothetical protein
MTPHPAWKDGNDTCVEEINFEMLYMCKARSPLAIPSGPERTTSIIS